MQRTVFTLIFLLKVAFSFAQSAATTSNKNFPPLMSAYVKLHLSTNSFFYQASDKVFFSAFILQPASLEPVQFPHTLDLVVLDSREQSIYSRRFHSEQGVISGVLPASLINSGGAYTLVATATMNGNKFTCRRKIIVQSVIRNSFLFSITPDKEQYVAGDSIRIKFNVRQQNGEAVRYTPVKISEQYLSATVNTFEVITDQTGMAELRTRLNPGYSVNDLVFSGQVLFQEQKFSRTERINLNTGDISVRAFFENGAYNKDIDNPMVMICSNENGELTNHSFSIIHLPTNDSIRVQSNAFGLCCYTLLKGRNPSDLRIRPATDKGRYFRLSMSSPGSMVLGTHQKTGGQILFSVYSDAEKNVFLLSHIRGVKVVMRNLRIMRGWNYFDVNASGFQQGVLQTLLMDSLYHILAEKLVYIHKEKTLHFKLDKYKLNANRSSELNIHVYDDAGKPVKGIFTLSITDENNFVALKDKQAKITENLLFENELNYPVNDIGKLFESGNDSLLDLFLAGCTMKNNFWKQILLEENLQNKIFCYQFKITTSRYNSIYGIPSIRKVTFYSDKGKFKTEPRADGTILVPVDTITFPATCITRYEHFRDILYVNKKDAKIVMLRDSVFISRKIDDSRVFVLKNLVKPPIQIVEEKKVPELYDQGLTSLGSRVDRTAVYIDGARVTTFNDCAVSARHNSSRLTQCGSTYYTSDHSIRSSGFRSYNSLAGLAGGVTQTQNGISGRGSRIDGVAYYIDGVRVFNNGTDLVMYNKINRIANPNMLRTSVVPYNNDIPGGFMSGSGSYNRYSTSARLSNFNFINDQQTSQSYVSAFDYLQGSMEDISCYYYYSHFTTNAEGKGSIVVRTPNNTMVWHINIQGTGGGQCGYLDTAAQVAKPVYMIMKSPSVMLRNDLSTIEIKIVNDSEEPVKVYLKNIMRPELNEAIPVIAAHSTYLYTESIEFRESFNELHYVLTVNPTEQQEIYKFIRIIDNNYKNMESYYVQKSMSRDLVVRKGNISQSLMLQCHAPFDKNLEAYLVLMIQEPHGCFEQVSSTNYPNILAYRFLQKNGSVESERGLEQKKHLVSGYQQLLRYETWSGGFSWYGDGNGNEALTAMGLLQFKKLAECHIPVDEIMIQRNRKWLMGKKNGNGQFIQSPGKYGFANMSEDVAHAYITYALHETGEKNLEKQVSIIENNLQSSKNLYNMTLLCAIYIGMDKHDYKKYLEQLKTAFDKIRESKSAAGYEIRTIVNSSPTGAINETFALIASSIYKHRVVEEYNFAGLICEYFIKQDKYAWGNMQSKAFVLEALAFHSEGSGDESMQSYVLKYTVNDSSKELIMIPGIAQTVNLSEFLHEGNNSVQIEFEGKRSMELDLQQVNVMPFSNSKSPDLSLLTEFDKPAFRQSELAIYHVRIENTSKKILPQTVAIISIPTGMNIDPDELQFLTKQKLCDFYEIRDNRIFLYWEEIDASALIDLRLPFVCEVAGQYTMSACSVYKYYQPEKKTFYLPGSIRIE